MPTIFEDRERGFEAKFAHDEELRFRVSARRDKLFSAWLTTQRTLSVVDAHDLQEAILAVPGGPGHDAAMLTLVSTGHARQFGNLSHVAMIAALQDCATRAAEQIAHDPI